MNDTPGIQHSYHHSCGCLWHTTLALVPEQLAWLAARPCPHHYDPDRPRREAEAEYRRAEAKFQRGRCNPRRAKKEPQSKTRATKRN